MENQRLKQRLVGTLVLVALMVIFVPMFFESPSPPSPSLDMPPPPPPKEVHVIPPGPVQLPPSEEPSEDILPSPPVAPKPPQAALQAWVIQLGTFRQEENATKLQDRVRAEGYPCFIETVRGRRGTLYRVRVGPFLDRKEAQTLLTRLEKVFRLKGLVLPHR